MQFPGKDPRPLDYMADKISTVEECTASPSFIDLFAGCGGLSLGLMRAGWRGILAVERNEMAFATLKHNLVDGRGRGIAPFQWPDWFPKEAISVGSFARRYADRIRESLRGQVDLVAGGPPCQSYSLSGARSPTDPRNHLWRDYLSVVDLVQPPLILIENVHGITIEFGREKARRLPPRPGRPREPYSVRIQRALEKRNYAVFQDLVLAADFGVPQYRPRHIMIGVKTPDPENSTNPFAAMRDVRESFVSSYGLPCDRYVTMRQAISDLRMAHGSYADPDSPRFRHGISAGPSTRYQRLLASRTGRHHPDSHRFANHRKEIETRFARMLRECRRGVRVDDQKLLGLGTRKLSVVVSHPNQPSHTLTTLPDDILHYSEPRILTVRECARLQSFPDWFEFKGKYTTGGRMRRHECPRYTQVGNAVPPLLAEACGLVLLDISRDRAGVVPVSSVQTSGVPLELPPGVEAT